MENPQDKLKRLLSFTRKEVPSNELTLRLLTIAQIRALVDVHGPKTCKWTINHEVPDSISAELSNSMIIGMAKCREKSNQEAEREVFRVTFGYWAPYRSTLDGIKQAITEIDPRYRQILEIGCGRGLAARLLQEEGINVYPTDISPYPASNSFTSIETLSHLKALKKYPDIKTLMICWPPKSGEQGDRLAAESLYHLKGVQFIYIGEPRGGRCGTEEFFNVLEKNWKLHVRLPVRRWPRLTDCAYVYRRNG